MKARFNLTLATQDLERYLSEMIAPVCRSKFLSMPKEFCPNYTPADCPTQSADPSKHPDALVLDGDRTTVLNSRFRREGNARHRVLPRQLHAFSIFSDTHRHVKGLPGIMPSGES